MAFHANYCPVFTALNYGCNNYNGAYQWTGDTPGASLIAAVEALPTTLNVIYSLTTNHANHAAFSALMALLTGPQAAAFVEWQLEQYAIACGVVEQANPKVAWAATCAQCQGKGYQGKKDDLSPLLVAAGLTRSAADGGL